MMKSASIVQQPQHRLGRQHGVALVIALVFLLLLTLLGITAMSTSALEEKMSGNLKDQTIAFQASESALRDGEANLRQKIAALGSQPPADTKASSGIWASDSVMDVTNNAWWKSNGIEYGGSGQQIPEAAADPKFVIEERDFEQDSFNIGKPPNENPPGVQYYRITAQGVGATSKAQAIVQATDQVRFR